MTDFSDRNCPFIQKECLYDQCALWHDAGGLSECAILATATRLKTVEKELAQIKNDISSLDLKFD